MAEPAPLDNSVKAGMLNGQPCNLVQEIVRGVRGQFPEATPVEVADEVRLRLDRFQRQAIKEQWTGDGDLVREPPAPAQAQLRSHGRARDAVTGAAGGDRHGLHDHARLAGHSLQPLIALGPENRTSRSR
jgi:hypothetical protein